MKLVNERSLAATLDNINDALFFNKVLSSKDKKDAAAWLVERRGLPGSYAGMFAPTRKDFAAPIRVFTGEKVTSGAATSHILGEETCRILVLLNDPRKRVAQALAQAGDTMYARIRECESGTSVIGMYCCGICSVSMWRHLAAGGFRQQARRLKAGMDALKAHRDGNGRWRRFPFYYTLLALHEIGTKQAREELFYAAPVCQRLLSRQTGRDKYTRRRKALLETVLAR
jgi:hypothetical protein